MTNDDKLRFDSICREVAAEGLDGAGIGTMAEKRMHKSLKRYICSDGSCHEVRIKPDGNPSTEGREKGESGRGGYIADIYRDGQIFEIQTAGFYPLKKKIEFYLKNTDFTVTVVHPLIAQKWSVWVDPETGETTKRRRSPKKEKLTDLLPEIFWLSDHLDSDRLYFRALIIEAEEYRMLDGWSRDKKKGSTRYERIPVALTDEVSFSSKEVAGLIPDTLNMEFTAPEFSKATGLRGRKAYYALKLLCIVGAAEKGEKRGRSFVYKRLLKETVKND